MNKKLIFPTIVIILALAGIVLLVRKPAMAPSEIPLTANNQSANTNESMHEATGSGAALSVSTQKAGSSAVIDQVTLTKPGFVVVHEDNAGKPGKIIGQTFLLTPGIKQDVVVKVTLQAGKTYYAMLHLDDGDKKFSAAADTPAKDAAGNPVMVKFSVSK